MHQLLGKPYLGQRVEVYKANMIIPQIKSGEISENAIFYFDIPNKCPHCEGEVLLEVSWESDTQNLVCQNPMCDGKLINRLDHFCGKKGLDIKGLSKTTLDKLIEWDWVKSYEDIFNLYIYKTEWINKPGFGEKSVNNILNAINESKNCDLDKFIAALGIPLIGSRASKDLSNHFGSWTDFINAIETKFKFYDLPNFGEKMHLSLIKFDYSEAILLANTYLDITTDEPKTADVASLEGKTFVITGKLDKHKNRDALKALIEGLGGKVSGSISGKTDYLINNDVSSTSSKNIAAKKLNIPVISEEQFIELLGV